VVGGGVRRRWGADGGLPVIPAGPDPRALTTSNPSSISLSPSPTTSSSPSSASPSCSVSVLSWQQVRRLDAVLTETIPIHGRGNFPTLQMEPREIVRVVRSRMEEKHIRVRDARLNGSAASHVLHGDGGLGYKDLDLIFCADMKAESDFQTVKDIVLDCLLDFLPDCVNKERITPLTLKVKTRTHHVAT